ncbi:MAG TPA: SpoIIE family protein phosphatase [Acidimicrobiales bacterium]|nr:SpoIIE family protein phosphatase [Acidimicrobiales bacterium]
MRSHVEVLARAARAVHGTGEIAEKLDWVTDQARSVTGASFAAFVGLGDQADMVAAAGVPVGEIDRFARPALARLVRPQPATPAVLRSADLALDRRHRRLLQRLELPEDASCLAVPVFGGDGMPLGALLLVHPRPDRFDAEDEATVIALGEHLGVAFDNLQTMERLAELQAVQREIVHQLQEAVQPPAVVAEAAELGVHYVSADPSSPTGGDLYDWLVLPDGDLHLAIVDVMGKGVAATKEAVSVCHALRLLTLEGCPMDQVVAKADTLTTAQSPDLVATVMVVRYRPSNGHVWLAGGGHPPALVIDQTGEVHLVSAPGIPIGYPGAGTTSLVELTLGRGDTLVLYTDGLIEATKDILSGLERITRAASETARYPARHLARALVERSLSGAKRRDDSLALVLRRRIPPGAVGSPPLGAFEYRFSPTLATVPLARHLLGDWLEHFPLDDAERGDLLLVASELCSNAVRHASGTPGALVIRAWADGDAVVVEVEDDGAGMELDHRPEDPDLDAEQGRGLYVVRALTDDLTVRRVGERTVVRAVRRAVLPA